MLVAPRCVVWRGWGSTPSARTGMCARMRRSARTRRRNARRCDTDLTRDDTGMRDEGARHGACFAQRTAHPGCSKTTLRRDRDRVGTRRTGLRKTWAAAGAWRARTMVRRSARETSDTCRSATFVCQVNLSTADLRPISVGSTRSVPYNRVVRMEVGTRARDLRAHLRGPESGRHPDPNHVRRER